MSLQGMESVSPGLSKGDAGMRPEREVLLRAPPDMPERNVDPELGMDGKSKGDAMESCAPS